MYVRVCVLWINAAITNSHVVNKQIRLVYVKSRKYPTKLQV